MNYLQTQPNIGQRIGATIIDYIIIFSFFFWFVLTFGEPNETGGKTVTGLPAFIPMVFWFFWLVVPEAIFGQTLGHALAGLRIVSMDGSKPGFGQSLKRRVCDALEISWCCGLVAFILVKNTQYHQRLGDIWAKTLVVDKDQQLSSKFEFENAN